MVVAALGCRFVVCMLLLWKVVCEACVNGKLKLDRSVRMLSRVHPVHCKCSLWVLPELQQPQRAACVHAITFMRSSLGVGACLLCLCTWLHLQHATAAACAGSGLDFDVLL
jgi:hypothetical protein